MTRSRLAALLVVSCLAAFALGLGAGWLLPGGARGPAGPGRPARADWPPIEFTRGRPVLEELDAGEFRLVVLGYGGPVQLVRRRCIQGSFDLAVFDRAGRPVYSMSNGEAREDCRADYADFAAAGQLTLVYHTWDCRSDTPVPWKVEALVFRPGRAPECSPRVALVAEPADDARLAELVREARRGLDMSGGGDEKNAQRGGRLLEYSLNRVRNAGADRPEAAMAALRSIKWADGAVAESITEYLEELEEIRRIRERRPDRPAGR